MRKKNFKRLYDRLKPYQDHFILPKSIPEADPSWFAFPITIRENSGITRTEVVNSLERKKVMTRMLFAGNLIKHPAYLNVKKRIASSLNVTDRVMKDTFFVGVYPGITEEMIEYVGDVFDEIMRKFK
jgi:CDP-6-deoxy-D-xylo-4-hexulose-3-dehydrase